MPKISQLTPATLPIVGNEVAIFNQNGSTFSSVLSNFIGGGSNVSSLSANWQNTYTSFSTNSADYAKVNVNNNFSSTQTFATVTLQNYFRMYHKLAGMTGTAETEAGEFWDIYKLDVVVIPTNRDNSRKDKKKF